MQDGDFITVVSKRKSRNRQVYAKNIGPEKEAFEPSEVNEEVAIRRLEAAKTDIATSDYFSSVLVVLRQGLRLLDVATYEEILCYGLGRFSECMTSRYQFALLLLLKENSGAKVFVHDPVFSVAECNILRNFGCELIVENEEGCRKLSGKPTLVYLPHCPKQLTDNFLRTNWSPSLLSSCLLLSNSLRQLVDTRTNRELSQDAPCSSALCPHSIELGLVNSFRYSDIFNDAALHVFPAKKLALISQDFWDIRPPSGYSKDDIEFISKESKPGFTL